MLIIKRLDEMSQQEIGLLKDVILEYGNFMYEELGLTAGKASFYSEMSQFPGTKYDAPEGTFFLALWKGEPAGCIGLRRFDEGSCEMKRMFVKPQYRGLGIAMELCNAFFRSVREFGYRKVLLDTNREMPEAIAIYRKLGFVAIPPYCVNANPNPVYFMKTL